ncbi:acyltransferase [Pendulispora albinea]|uniref:N-acetyltransferase n=1 Tax=Pendulispora albinea TaxID=2741071 RepID=A0ABZ2LRU3_9BACT
MRDPSVFVHSTALCESEDIGARTRVFAFAHVMPGARVGTDCKLYDFSIIDKGAVVGNRVLVKAYTVICEGVTIEDDVFIGPHIAFTNDRVPRGSADDGWTLTRTLVRRGASLGANATIVCGVTIGAHAMVAAGSVVTRDVPDHALVMGNPARQRAWVCFCGFRLASGHPCAKCGRSPAPPLSL